MYIPFLLFERCNNNYQKYMTMPIRIRTINSLFTIYIGSIRTICVLARYPCSCGHQKCVDIPVIIFTDQARL